MKANKSSMDAGYMLDTYFRRNGWFENCGYSRKWVNVGPWGTGSTPDETQTRNRIGELMRKNAFVSRKNLGECDNLISIQGIRKFA